MIDKTFKSFADELLELIDEIASRKGAGSTKARRLGNDLRKDLNAEDEYGADFGADDYNEEDET